MRRRNTSGPSSEDLIEQRHMVVYINTNWNLFVSAVRYLNPLVAGPEGQLLYTLEYL